MTTTAWVVRGSLLALALFLGCGRVSGDTGGETNWLRCTRNEDCPSGVECRVGYCGGPPSGQPVSNGSGGTPPVPAPPPGSAGSTSAPASPGGSGGSEPGDGLPCDINALMTKSCWGIGCHGNMMPAAELDLQSPFVDARVVDVSASHMHIIDGTEGMCLPDELRVDSANPDDSLILKKVLGTQSCGQQMPIPPRSVTLSDMACLRAWVHALAGKPVPPGAWPPPPWGGSGGGGAGGPTGGGGTNTGNSADGGVGGN